MSEETENKYSLEQRILELREQSLEQRKKELAVSIEQETYATKALANAELEIKIREEGLKILEKFGSTELEIAETAEKIREKIEKLNQKDLAGNAKKIAALTQELDIAEQLLEMGNEGIKRRKEQLELEIRMQEAVKKRVQLADQLSGTLAGVFQMSEDWKQSSLAQLGILGGSGGIGDLMSQISEKFSLMNFAGNMSRKGLEAVTAATVNLAREQDSAIAQFRKATGAGAEYDDVMIDAYINTRTFGIGQAEAAQATQELFVSMSGFTGLDTSMQTQLTETAALLKEMGISVSITGKNFDIMTKSLGMSADQADQTTKRLFSLSQTLGIPPDVIMSEFGPAMKTLAAHGDDAVEIFGNMAAAAKVTGIEMSSLLSIVGKFDQFESGAQAVGKLNALMGGPYLNTVEMLKMSEEERIMAMIKATEASGKQFSTMSKYEQMAFAAAAGISDMAEANKLFGQSSEAYQMQLDRAKESEGQQKKLNEVIRDSQGVFDKFKMILSNLAIEMRPLIEVMGDVADYILDVQKEADSLSGMLTGVVVVAVSAVTLTLGGLAAGLKATAAVAVPAGTSIGSGIAAMGTAALAGAKGLGVLTLVVIGLAAAFAIAGPSIIGIMKQIPLILDAITGEKVMGFASMLTTMALMGPAALVGLTALAGGLYMVAGAMALIDAEKLDGLSSLSSNIVDLSNIPEGKAKSAEVLIKSIRDLNVAAAASGPMGFLNLSALSVLIENLSKINVASAGAMQAKADVTLEIDGEILARKLIDIINSEYS